MNRYEPPNNTKVLKEAGYKFPEDTYKPREYVRCKNGCLHRAVKKHD